MFYKSLILKGQIKTCKDVLFKSQKCKYTHISDLLSNGSK